MATKTIGTGTLGITPDYSTIALWESYLNGLGAFSENEIGRVCWAGSGNELATASGLAFDGSSPGAFTITLEAGDTNGNQGGSFRDNADKATNALRYNANNGACVLINSGTSTGITVADPNVIIRYLQIKKTSSYNQFLDMAGSGDAGKEVDSCIIQLDCGASDFMISSYGTITNCLVLYNDSSNTGNSTGGIVHGPSGGTSTWTNNTVVCTDGAGSRRALRKAYNDSVIVARNNAIYGFGEDWSGSTSNVTASNNATDLTSGGTSTLPGSNNQFGLVGSDEWESVTQDSEDFRLKSTSTKCKENATSTGAPTVDIVGQARS